MADINEVIDIMVANGAPQEKIMEVINDYNKSTKEPDSTDEVEEVTEVKEEPIRTWRDTAAKLEEGRKKSRSKGRPNTARRHCGRRRYGIYWGECFIGITKKQPNGHNNFV